MPRGDHSKPTSRASNIFMVFIRCLSVRLVRRSKSLGLNKSRRSRLSFISKKYVQLTESESAGGRVCLISSGLKRSWGSAVPSVRGQRFLISLDSAMKTEVLPTLFSPTYMFKSFDGVKDSDLKHLKFLR